jgi:Gpi18-like mannosyltransferase
MIKKLDQELKKSFYVRALFYVFFTFLVLRIFTSLVLLIGVFQPATVYPTLDTTRNTLVTLEQESGFSRLFLAPWYRWDTVHYLEIAEFGYDFDPVNTIWPPLYPFLIKTMNLVFQPSLLAGILVSNIFFVFGLFLTYWLTTGIFDEKTAKNTLLFLVCFPMSFYFVAAYSESLFLVLCAAVLLLIKRKKWLWAGVVSALASLTRVQGIFLIIPILVELIRQYDKDRNLKYLLVNVFSCVYAPFAYGLYSLYVFFGLRADWPWNTLSSYWLQRFSLPWEGFYFTFLSILGKNTHIDYSPLLVKILNIILPLFSIYILIAIRRKIPLSYSIYSWIMLILVVGKIDYNNTLVSTARYLLTTIPIFMGMAMILNHKYLRLAYFSIGIMLQTILIIFFYWWFWVA